jgi:hypothetical protein
MSFMEFTYNKYQATIGMTSYEALYGKKMSNIDMLGGDQW